MIEKSNKMENFVEPGAVRHGNFINYYNFNSASERLNLLPIDTALWTTESLDDVNSPYLVLDVGCNAGNFTQLFYEFLAQKLNKKIVVFGIDIDPVLIERAEELNTHKENVFYSCCDIMEQTTGENCIGDHLKKFQRSYFDVVSCFSITMWIHLNNGDDGLKRFLDAVSRLCEVLIIEPQPWKCYQNAVRRMKRAQAPDTFPLHASLKIRNNVENDIKEYLRDVCDFMICFESDPTKWKRRICFLRNNLK